MAEDARAHLNCIVLTNMVDASLELVYGRDKEPRDLGLQGTEKLGLSGLVDVASDDLRLDIEAEELAEPRRRELEVVEREEPSDRGGELAFELLWPR